VFADENGSDLVTDFEDGDRIDLRAVHSISSFRRPAGWRGSGQR
jgi:hypothetical protein